MDKNIIQKYINDNLIEELILYSKSLSPNDYRILTGWLINQLVSYKIPENTKQLNTIALVLSDLKCNEAVPQIIELLKKHGESLYVGTLVYVLQNLECADYLEQIFHLLYVGNYEVRRNMFTLLEENREKISPYMYDRMKEKLIKAIEDYKDKLLGLYIAQDEIFDN